MIYSGHEILWLDRVSLADYHVWDQVAVKPKGAKRIYHTYSSQILSNLLHLENCLEPYSTKTFTQNSKRDLYLPNGCTYIFQI